MNGFSDCLGFMFLNSSEDAVCMTALRPTTGITGLRWRATVMLPFPATDRSVSGRNNAIQRRQIVTKITMNHWVDLQPKVWDNAPPTAGAMHGASMGPRLNIPKYPPRSLGVDISPMTPAPKAIVLALPPDWKHRSSNSSQNEFVGHNDIPILDRMRMVRHTR